MIDCILINMIFKGTYIPESKYQMHRIDLRWAMTIATACVAWLNSPAGRHGDYVLVQLQGAKDCRPESEVAGGSN